MCKRLDHTKALLPGIHTVTILSDFAVFRAVDNEWLVASGGKLLRVRVFDLEGHSLATKPVT